MPTARLLVVLASALAAMGATCSTVAPTNAGVAGVPLSSSSPTAIGVAAIAALGQSRGAFGGLGGLQTSVALEPMLARRFDLLDDLSLDLGAAGGTFTSTVSEGVNGVAGVSVRLWADPDGAIPFGLELGAVTLVERIGVVPTVVAFGEVRALAAYRLPGPGSLWLCTRPGLYRVPLGFNAVGLSMIEWPMGVAFDVGPARIGADVGVDWWPAEALLGARLTASAAATF